MKEEENMKNFKTASISTIFTITFLFLAACSSKNDVKLEETTSSPASLQETSIFPEKNLETENNSLKKGDASDNNSIDDSTNINDNNIPPASSDETFGEPKASEYEINYDGTYFGTLQNGLVFSLTISQYSSSGFDFDFQKDQKGSIAGHAEFADDGYAYFSDENGKGIIFQLDNSSVIVDGGVLYGSLAATYTQQ